MSTSTASATTPTRRRLLRLGRGALAMVLFAVPFVLIGFAVRQKFDPLVHLDQTIAEHATDVTRSVGAGPALIVLQAVSQPWVLYIVATLVCVWAWLVKGLRNRALWAFVTMMVGWNLALDAKLLVQRARPVIHDPISHAPGFSFPSGHAANAAIIATTMVFLLWPVLSHGGRRVAVTLAVVGAFVVGLDRIFLGVHFMSDVLAAWILGVGTTFSSWQGFIGRTSPTSSAGPSHPA
ncbi:phosphatase PAP2 family protein [Pedococcus sp. KACC 23699]|uniref:Phosphatase PAP2 family protein n=1 Tax=Pedococcus sp. KACC 23699 TaxID=3149228 RepID=A0AAU7JZZ4_9MICO